MIGYALGIGGDMKFDVQIRDYGVFGVASVSGLLFQASLAYGISK
jgi:hypothetical protein